MTFLKGKDVFGILALLVLVVLPLCLDRQLWPEHSILALFN